MTNSKKIRSGILKCRCFLGIAVLQAAVLSAMVFWPVVSGKDDSRREVLVEALMLTDLAIWTEARYTRHPSQADFYSAFQDCPGALEHFPAGMWVPPPNFLRAETIAPFDRKIAGESR